MSSFTSFYTQIQHIAAGTSYYAYLGIEDDSFGKHN